MKDVAEPKYVKRQIEALVETYGKSSLGVYIITHALEDILGGEVRIDDEPYYKRERYQDLWAEETRREIHSHA